MTEKRGDSLEHLGHTYRDLSTGEEWTYDGELVEPRPDNPAPRSKNPKSRKRADLVSGAPKDELTTTRSVGKSAKPRKGK